MGKKTDAKYKKLLNQALMLSKKKSERQVLLAALQNLIESLERKSMSSLKGKIHWEGDLEEMRKW
ncbi:MAG: type II toxin-antitoxin system VapB family antitoxin [Bacteroidia bacterium]